MQLIPGALIGGKYELERPLASGGMGSIWVARHIGLEVPVAVKVINQDRASYPDLRSRFEREARASARICSAHVVHVYDYGLEGDMPYLIMELLEGEDLGVRLKQSPRLSLNAVARVLLQVAKGLRKAHEAGFIHRDLKPSNIFLARSDDDEVVKILDFGVAKWTGDPLGESTKTGEIMGSPHYMSPEQIQESKSIDARSDLWSLGVILFRALTGEMPFPGDACGVVMAKILTGSIPLPSHFVADLPQALDAFFRRAFERDPRRRFQTAREMAEGFAQAAFGTTRPTPSWSFAATAPRPAPPMTPPLSSTRPVQVSETMLSPSLPLRPLIVHASPPPLELLSIDKTGTLTAALRVPHQEASATPRRSLRWFGLGAGGIAGIVLGWSLLSSLFGGTTASADGARHAAPTLLAASPAVGATDSTSSAEDPSAAAPSAKPESLSLPAGANDPGGAGPPAAGASGVPPSASDRSTGGERPPTGSSAAATREGRIPSPAYPELRPQGPRRPRLGF